MDFTIEFIRMFAVGIIYTGPILLFLVLLIVILGQIIGRHESWNRLDALYFSFITATTVGYGDFRPASRSGKILAIVIALVGLIFTGIVVAVGVKAVTVAFTQIYDIPVAK